MNKSRRRGGVALTSCSQTAIDLRRSWRRPRSCRRPQVAIEAEGWTDAQRAAGDALRRQVDASPLYATAIAPSGLASCGIARADGALSIRLQATAGNTLSIERDDAIESGDQEARFTAPLVEEPLALLGRVEKAAFAPDGCGIDWKNPEAAADETGTMQVYRGTTCNCAAGVHRNASGVVDAIGLRSAC